MTDKITSVVAKEDNGNVQITFTVPWKLIQSAQTEALEHMGDDVEVPGFRKGKAPLDKVREKIPEGKLVEHSLGHLLPKALGEAIDEHKLKLAMYPKYELIKAKEGEDWEVKAFSCELPQIKLGDYKNIVAGELRAASLKGELTKEQKESVIIKALIDYVKIDVPSILVEEEANSRLSQLLARLEKLGLALENYLTSVGKKADDLKADYALQAKEAISMDLILNEVAIDQNIKVTPEEIDSALKASGVENPEPDRRVLIESILKRRGALDFFLKQV